MHCPRLEQTSTTNVGVCCNGPACFGFVCRFSAVFSGVLLFSIFSDHVEFLFAAIVKKLCP
jgi:hypothetical protein